MLQLEKYMTFVRQRDKGKQACIEVYAEEKEEKIMGNKLNDVGPMSYLFFVLS
jgi:hypothetical protein